MDRKRTSKAGCSVLGAGHAGRCRRQRLVCGRCCAGQAEFCIVKPTNRKGALFATQEKRPVPSSQAPSRAVDHFPSPSPAGKRRRRVAHILSKSCPCPHSSLGFRTRSSRAGVRGLALPPHTRGYPESSGRQKKGLCKVDPCTERRPWIFKQLPSGLHAGSRQAGCTYTSASANLARPRSPTSRMCVCVCVCHGSGHD